MKFESSFTALHSLLLCFIDIDVTNLQLCYVWCKKGNKQLWCL